MKKLLGIVFFFTLLSAFAQTEQSFVSTKADIIIYTLDFPKSTTLLQSFISDNKIKIQSQNASKSSMNVFFELSAEQYASLASIVSTMGFVSSNNINTENNNNRVQEIELELAYLRKQLTDDEEVMKKQNTESDRYFSIWNDIKALQGKIFNSERELLKYSAKQNSFYVRIEINDEQATPTDTRVTFVNMPGAEYSYLSISTPSAGLTASAYQGYFVKYLFTKGKSYGMAGAYKSLNTGSKDTTTLSELFLLGFGQDFYSRHLGKGAKRFLNLYSGYTVGGMFATSDTQKKNILYINPSVGLELFKNKYILIDTIATYFIPFTYNRNLRGLTYNASFNFVF